MAGMEITIKFPEIEYQLKRIADALQDNGTEGIIATPSLKFVVTDQETITMARKSRKGKDTTVLKMVGYFQLSTTDPADGITERNLSVKNADTSEVLHSESLPGDSVKSGEVKLAVGLNCSATLVDQDDAGNKSEPFEADFTVTDVMAPPKPGMTGFVPTGQVDEP